MRRRGQRNHPRTRLKSKSQRTVPHTALAGNKACRLPRRAHTHVGNEAACAVVAQPCSRRGETPWVSGGRAVGLLGARRPRRVLQEPTPTRLRDSGVTASRPATKDAPAVRGSACTTYAIRSPRFSCRRAFTLCRCRSGWATERLHSLWTCMAITYPRKMAARSTLTGANRPGEAGRPTGQRH